MAVRQAAIDILGADGQYVTVAMQDVEPAVWKDQVYTAEIVDNPHLILRHNAIVPPAGMKKDD